MAMHKWSKVIVMLPTLRPFNIYASLYLLKVEDLVKLKGMGKKSAEKLVANIQKSINTSFAKSLISLGIREVGGYVAEILANHYIHMDDLVYATYEELVNIKGIGPKIANSIIRSFKTYQYDSIAIVEVGTNKPYIKSMKIQNYRSLRMDIKEGLHQTLTLQDESCYQQLANYLVDVVMKKVAEDGGLYDPSDGGWYEWLMRGNLQTGIISDTQRENLDELLAFAFMDDNIDDLTPKILKILGMT